MTTARPGTSWTGCVGGAPGWGQPMTLTSVQMSATQMPPVDFKSPASQGDWYSPPRLERVALDVGLGAAGATVGAQVDGATGAIVGGAAAVAWSRVRHPSK